MRNVLVFMFSLFALTTYSQKKDLTITATSNLEAEVLIKIINNTSKNKLLFLDVKNIGIFYKSKMIFTNINSSKMYLDFLELNGNKSFIPVSTFHNYNSGIKNREDFKSEIKNNTILILPNQEKQFIINLYRQDESDYLKDYKILPSKTFKVQIKIIGNQIKKKCYSIPRKIIEKYDFNYYESNIFEIKIKTAKMPPPSPRPPNNKVIKYSFDELMFKKF